jgi:Zn-dependent protease
LALIDPIFWLSLVAALVLHEFAHLAAAYVTGVNVKRFGFSWKGPYIVREPGTPIQNTFISLAGPGINLVLSVLCWRSLGMFAWVNGLLGTFNLLPIPASDGLRVYRIWKRSR